MFCPLCPFRKFLCSLVLFLSICYFSPMKAYAQVYNSSISTATGGTGRAAVEPGDALLLNPSTLSHLQGRFIFTSFAKDEFTASLSDNTTESTLPAGLSLVQKKSTIFLGNSLQDVKFQDIAISIADFIVDKWTVGITGHYVEQNLVAASYVQTNADLGFLYTPNANTGLGLVFYNVFGEKENIPQDLKQKTTVGAGLNYIYHDSIRTRLDVTSESIFAGGLETYLNKFVITRLGYSNSFRDQRQILSLGVGFNGPRFQINYAYVGNSQNSSDYRHSVDMVIPF